MKEYLKFSWLLLKNRKIKPQVLLFALGFCQVWYSLFTFSELFLVQANTIELYCTGLAGADSEQAAKELNLTKYLESTVQAAFGEYANTVSLCGVEKSYLDEQFGGSISIDMEEDKPYVLVESQVLVYLKNSKGDVMEIPDFDVYIAENLRIGKGDITEARICGIISDDHVKTGDEEDLAEQMPRIYTTLGGFSSLVKEEAGLEEQAAQYMTKLPDGKQLDEDIRLLEENGFVVNNQDAIYDRVQRGEILKIRGQYQIFFAILYILWGSTVNYMQDRRWCIENKEFLAYSRCFHKKSSKLKWIWVFQWCWIIGLSLLISGVLLVLSKMLRIG